MATLEEAQALSDVPTTAPGGGTHCDVTSSNSSGAGATTTTSPPTHDTAAAGGENVSAASSYNRQLSISETVEQSGGAGSRAPWFLQFIEKPFHVADPNTGNVLAEVCAWGMDSAARGPLNLVGSYVGGAILRMAIKEAGGPNNTVRGGLLKPSSLLTAMSSATGVIAALLMPVMGAIVDHTKHRRLVGVLSGTMAVALIGIQISISVERNNWFFILVIDAIQSFCLLVHVAAVFAYLPDLSHDEAVVGHYASRLNLRQYTVLFGYTLLVILVTRARGNQDKPGLAASVQTARDAAGMAFGFGALFIWYAWTFLFRDRPALSQVPDGSNLLTTGFVQVHRTSSKIWTKYRALKWFMISLLWSPEAGAGVVLSIAVTYLTVVVKFTGQDLGKSTLSLLAATVFGSLWSKVACRILNPLNSYRCGMTFLGVSIGLGAWLFKGPDDKNAVFGLAAVWGLALGWTYPSQRVLFVTLIPKGQETEMMGLFTFTGQILGWLPPFVVTMLNENDVDLKWSLIVVCIFCVFAVINTLPMGSYQDAVETVTRDSEEKYKQVRDSARQHALNGNSERGGEDTTAAEKMEAGKAATTAVEAPEAPEEPSHHSNVSA